MAVCNLFNDLTSPSGNFLMFSQYVEDVTHNYTEGDNWKVVPTGFVALDIDYSKIDKKVVLNDYKETMNTGIPKYFQNYFENGCAYGRNKTKKGDWDGLEENSWNPGISRNLFWNSMFNAKFIHAEKYGSSTSNISYIPEVKYFGNIDMHSYNEHKGMGYSEIYCYIPSDAERMNCQVKFDEDVNFDASNNSLFLEGYNDPNFAIDGYPTEYYYDRNHRMNFDDNYISNLLNGIETQYNINTIVVLYSIYVKNVSSITSNVYKEQQRYNTIEEGISSLEEYSYDINNLSSSDWELIYYNLPMGMYIMGNFDDSGKLTNSATKYVTTSYNTGTSYGLRICSRFSATSNGTLFNTDVVADDTNYANMCQLMTAMNENLSLMLDVTKTTAKLTEQYKELESRLKNQKTNVPYVKCINGTDYWFVNGKMVATVEQGTTSGSYVQLSPQTVQQRLDNLMDDSELNDYAYIDDPNGPNYVPFTPRELAKELEIEGDYPGTTTSNVELCIVANDEEVENEFKDDSEKEYE